MIRPLIALAAGALAVGVVLGGCSAADPAPATEEESMTSPNAPAPTEVRAAGTTRPTLSWDPVPGAGAYRLVVVPADGPPWAWSGTDTSVVAGGGSQDRPGPGWRLAGPATVYLVAVDPQGRTVATASNGIG